MPLRKLLSFSVTILTLCSAVTAFAQADSSTPSDTFSVLHFTDVHISPHVAGSPPPGAPRGGATIRWICEQAGRPQRLTDDFTAPAPAFSLVTGDLTEYGVIDDTWDIFTNAWKDLPCPMYVLPGNHDNTWVAMYHVMRQRHGTVNYSFDHDGFRFLCISSASPQEPVPSIDADTRTWLRAELERTGPEQPVILALHHPPASTEFAQPAEIDTLLDLLRDYNVVLLLYGHGHAAQVKDIGGLAGIMGGSTFGKNAGYGLLVIGNNTLHYAYRRYSDNDSADWTILHEAPIPTRAKPRVSELVSPAAGQVIAGDELSVSVRQLADNAQSVALTVDGNPITGVDFENARADAQVALDTLTPGSHLLSARVYADDQLVDIHVRAFHVKRSGFDNLWRRQLPAAIKAQPIIIGDLLIVAGNDGLLRAFDKATGQPRWEFATAGEILGALAVAGDTIIFGSGDGHTYAVNTSGKLRWKHAVGVPVYGWPVVADDTVYIGDNGGRMHALDLNTGEPRWTFERANYAIESFPAVWDDLLVFGAWDGYLYAVDRDAGTLRWKVWGPKSSDGKAERYYAPADCGPVVVGDALFVCDRGYKVGRYDRAGKLQQQWETGVSALAAGPSGQTLIARGRGDHLRRLDAAGEQLWEADVSAGRFPCPPTVLGDNVYICSNTGLLSECDLRTGNVRWSYQATPGFYVMAPVAAEQTAAGVVCYVAGMDGTLIALRK